MPDQLLIDLRLRKVEPREIAMHREAGGMHLVADRTHDPIGVFGLQEMLDQPARRLDARSATRGQFLPGASHAVQA